VELIDVDPTDNLVKIMLNDAVDELDKYMQSKEMLEIGN